MVQSKVVMRDQDGKSKGFGFINFDTHENAQRAVEELNNTEFHGKAIYVGRAMKKAERQALLREQYEQRKAERYACMYACLCMCGVESLGSNSATLFPFIILRTIFPQLEC